MLVEEVLRYRDGFGKVGSSLKDDSYSLPNSMSRCGSRRGSRRGSRDRHSMWCFPCLLNELLGLLILDENRRVATFVWVVRQCNSSISTGELFVGGCGRQTKQRQFCLHGGHGVTEDKTQELRAAQVKAYKNTNCTMTSPVATATLSHTTNSKIKCLNACKTMLSTIEHNLKTVCLVCVMHPVHQVRMSNFSNSIKTITNVTSYVCPNNRETMSKQHEYPTANDRCIHVLDFLQKADWRLLSECVQLNFYQSLPSTRGSS